MSPVADFDRLARPNAIALPEIARTVHRTKAGHMVGFVEIAP